jgi:hypothetical protein
LISGKAAKSQELRVPELSWALDPAEKCSSGADIISASHYGLSCEATSVPPILSHSQNNNVESTMSGGQDHRETAQATSDDQLDTRLSERRDNISPNTAVSYSDDPTSSLAGTPNSSHVPIAEPQSLEHWSHSSYPRADHQGISEQRDTFSPLAHPLHSQRTFRCLKPLLPKLHGIITAKEAFELLESFFSAQRNSWSRSASPYVVTHVLRPSSILHPTNPRPISQALLAVMLFCVAQTADMKLFDPPGARQRITTELYRLSLALVELEDPDNYSRTPGIHTQIVVVVI